MSQHIVIYSSFLLHLLAEPFCCGVSEMVFSCTMPASMQYIMDCSESNSFRLFCLCFLGVSTLRTNFFTLAIASLSALIKSTNTNFVYCFANTRQSRNPEGDYTLKSHIREHSLLLLFCVGISHSCYPSLCDLSQPAHIAYIIQIPTVSGAFVATSA